MYSRECPDCGARVRVQAIDLFKRSGPYSECAGCKRRLHHSFIVSIAISLCGWGGGGFVAVQTLRAAESALGAPVPLWAWLLVFAAGFSAILLTSLAIANVVCFLRALLPR
ncbi:hypothetical protein [Pseudomonas sp. CGJS7]|uniref:hypothetical protein n=1 Tax=Pseudomonas sp. CGJS7 TaxID=3109348 RepID=UPI00300B455E